MPDNVSIPPSLTAWKPPAANVKNTPKNTLDKDIGSLSKQHSQLSWDLLNHDKITSAGDINQRITDIQTAKKTADSVAAQASAVSKGAEAFAKAAGKDYDKAVLTSINKIKADASSLGSEIQKKFDDALKELKDKLNKAPKAGAKSAAPPGGAPVNKADEMLLTKLSKKAVAYAMKPKPGAKPMMFAVIGKLPATAKVLMGTKTEVAKLIGKFWKVDPKTKKKAPLAKDPGSQMLFEKGALVFVSAKIPANLIGAVKKAITRQIKKSPKVKWRKPGQPDIEAEGGGEDLKVEDLQEAEEKVDPREQMAAQGRFKTLLEELKKAMAAALPTKSADDRKEISETLAEANDAAKKGDHVEAVSLLEAVQTMLEDSAEGEEEEGAEGETAEAEAGAATPAAKSAAAPAGAPAAPAAKTAGGSDLSGLGSELSTNVKQAFDGIDQLARAIVKMYPAAQRPPNLATAVEQLKNCQKELTKYDFQNVLKGVSQAKDDADRTKRLQAAQQSLREARAFVNGNDIMKTLDNHGVEGVGNLTAAANLKATLDKIESSLR